ncbi:MAG: hypothetical protein AAGB10_14050 [Pseudomonadota bacterium]
MTSTLEQPQNGTRRTLRWLLAGQLALAALLILIDLGPTIPQLLSPSSVPDLDRPTRPGDQTRRYRLIDPARPETGVDPDMPRRLLVERVTIDGQEALRLSGAIVPGDGARVTAEVTQTRPAIVALNSPGGSVADALEIGRMLRAMDIETRLQADAVCFSACPYVFVGGTGRRVAEAARLGVHQHSFGESRILPAFLAVEDIQRGQAEVLAFLDEMGIDLRIMGPAMRTPADEIYILTSDELIDWGVVTE